MTEEVCVRINLPVAFRDGMQLQVMVPLQVSFLKVFEQLSDHGRRDAFDHQPGQRTKEKAILLDSRKSLKVHRSQLRV
jgi:hypothetical protein